MSTAITIDFINIPIPIENPTSPFRYSFFQGLKYVFNKRGKENNCKNALLKEAKKETSHLGASKNQNFRKTKGSLK